MSLKGAPGNISCALLPWQPLTRITAAEIDNKLWNQFSCSFQGDINSPQRWTLLNERTRVTEFQWKLRHDKAFTKYCWYGLIFMLMYTMNDTTGVWTIWSLIRMVSFCLVKWQCVLDKLVKLICYWHPLKIPQNFAQRTNLSHNTFITVSTITTINTALTTIHLSCALSVFMWIFSEGIFM